MTSAKTSLSFREIRQHQIKGLSFLFNSNHTYKGLDTRKYPTLKASVEASPMPLVAMFYPAWYLYELTGHCFGENKRGLNKFKRKYYEKMLNWILTEKITEIYV